MAMPCSPGPIDPGPYRAALRPLPLPLTGRGFFIACRPLRRLRGPERPVAPCRHCDPRRPAAACLRRS